MYDAKLHMTNDVCFFTAMAASAIMDPLLDVCVRDLIMDPLLDVCVREPIMDPLLDVFCRLWLLALM